MYYLTLILSLLFMSLMSVLKCLGFSLSVQAVVKTVASIFFVLTGLVSVNASKEKWNKFSRLIFCGLILGMAGDAVLAFDYLGLAYFIVGLLFFISGHVFYFMGFCSKSKVRPKDFILGAVVFVAFTSFLLISSDKFDYGGLFPAIIIYGIIIFCMLSKAFTFAKDFKNNKRTVSLILTGTFLFALSDFLLLLRLFYSLEPSCIIYVDIVSLAAYYIGQCLIALSLTKQLPQE